LRSALRAAIIVPPTNIGVSTATTRLPSRGMMLIAIRMTMNTTQIPIQTPGESLNRRHASRYHATPWSAGTLRARSSTAWSPAT
jgi:hypothetical protein